MNDRFYAFDLQQFALTPPPIDGDDASRRAAVESSTTDETDFERAFAEENKDALSKDYSLGDESDSAEGDNDDEGDATLNAILRGETEVDDSRKPSETRKERKIARESKAAADAEAAAAKAAAVAEAAPVASTAPATPATAPVGGAAPATAPIDPPKPKSYDPQERIALGLAPDGTTEIAWPREHVIAAINDRAKLIEIDKAWIEVMGTDLAGAQKFWQPITSAARKNPEMAQTLQTVADAFIGDPDLSDYIRECLRYHAEVRASRGQSAPRAAQPPAQPVQDPALLARIAQMETSLASRSKAEVEARVSSELNGIVAKYPALASNPQLVRRIAFDAQARINAGDTSYTLTRAADDAFAFASAFAPAAAPAAAAAPALPVAPALAGGGGASPGGARRVPDMTPRVSRSADEAIENYLRDFPDPIQ